MIVSNMGGYCPPISLNRYWVGSLISGLFGIGSSAINAVSSKKIADKQIAAQKEANDKNIELAKWKTEYDNNAQKEINQQNIDYQQGVNAMMRNDQLHQKSNQIRDTKAAGMSTASAEGNGFATAQLTAPNQIAPQATIPDIQPEMSNSSVAGLFGASSKIADILAELPERIQRTRKELATAKGQEQQNATYDQLMDYTFAQMATNIQQTLSTAELNDAQRFKVNEETTNLQQQFKLFTEQIRQAKFTSDHQEEQFRADINKLFADTKAALSASDANEANKLLTDAKKEYQDIVNEYAKHGIRFESADWIDTIARLSSDGNTKHIWNGIKSSVFDLVDECNPFSFKWPRSLSEGVQKLTGKGVRPLKGGHGAIGKW